MYEVIQKEIRIAAIFEILRCEMNYNFDVIAAELLIDTDSVRLIKNLSNEEISNDMLFRLYYMCCETINNMHITDYERCCANHLKSVCIKEIGKR